MTARAWVEGLTFSGGQTLRFGADDVVLVVGPNNSGKSATLRGIRDRLVSNQASPVIIDIELRRAGTPEDVEVWLDAFTRKHDELSPDPAYQAMGVGIHRSHIARAWSTNDPYMHGLGRFFCHLLSADERLQASVPADSIPMLQQPPTHPTHYLFRSDELERTLSGQFRKAFGLDLVVHRLAGARIPLHVGERPTPPDGKDRLSQEYVRELERLPLLHQQGDGMRSFAGVLLHTSVGRESILLIDEPEAFLHPPQARLIGRMLAGQKATGRQMFVATHSGDVLRGVLDAGSPRVRVVRLRRNGATNVVRELDNEKVVQLWNDPLLRYSNILDGLFHERVVVCEADSDARFYSAVADAVVEASGDEVHRPDIMFTHCGGKHRVPVVARALRNLDVPLTVVVDIDVLREEQPLRAILEACGGSWDSVLSDWKALKSAVDSQKPELSAAEVVSEVSGILASVSGQNFPKKAKDDIQAVFRRASPWASIKRSGEAALPTGGPTQAYKRLVETLAEIGVRVVPVGELEGFVRSVGDHGPKWVNEVLNRSLVSDPDLAAARQFVKQLIA